MRSGGGSGEQEPGTRQPGREVRGLKRSLVLFGLSAWQDHGGFHQCPLDRAAIRPRKRHRLQSFKGTSDVGLQGPKLHGTWSQAHAHAFTQGALKKVRYEAR